MPSLKLHAPAAQKAIFSAITRISGKPIDLGDIAMNRWIIITAGLLTMLTTGCQLIEERVIYDRSAEPAQAAPSPSVQPNAEVIERRFVNPDTQAVDAVQSAVVWAQKYEQVVEQNNELRDKHNQLFVENTQLSRQLETAKDDLERTRKELNEANTFLQEMHVELNKWKSDVLGFREEMRLAQKAQIEALSRILQILGAEPVRTSEQ